MGYLINYAPSNLHKFQRNFKNNLHYANFFFLHYHNLGFSSEQVAMVLRCSQHHGSVRFIVARPIEPTSPDYHMISSTAPIIPTKMLTGDPEELDKTLQTAGYAATAGKIF